MLLNLAIVFGAMTALWLLSLYLEDASIVDIFWGAGFALVAWSSYLWGQGDLLVTLLVTVWGLRLAGYLAWRNLGKGEDRRYQQWRGQYGDRFKLVSLASVFWLQGLLMWVVSLPVQRAGIGEHLLALRLVGLAVFAVGLTFEAVGDLQLARFKADPTNQGKVMDRGLWRYTRHPNYFGDFLVWWGLFLVSCASVGESWTAVGPLGMSVFLLRVSGVTLLESSIEDRRPAYADYKQRTNAFFPGPPKTRAV